MTADPLCQACGHSRVAHRPYPVPAFPAADGRLSTEYQYGRCEHNRWAFPMDIVCPCPLYVHDCFPRVTELLGFEARLGIERATGARPTPRTIPLGDYQEGDLITQFNGIAIDSPDQSAKIFQELANASEFNVVVRGADGTESTKNFTPE